MKSKRVELLIFIFLLVSGLTIIILPNSFLSILLFISGGYLSVLGYFALVSGLTLIKYKKGWTIDLIKAFILLFIGAILLFNSSTIASFLSGFLSVIIGLIVLAFGIIVIMKKNLNSVGVFFIIIGLLISLNPVGFSYFIIRLIGILLIALSVYLINNKTRSS